MSIAPPRGAHIGSPLRGHAALVLGAAGEHGAAAATALADLGADVIVADADAAELGRRFAGDARFGIRTVSPGSIEQVQDLARTLGDIDVLVHCAPPVDGSATTRDARSSAAPSSCLAAIRAFLPAMAARRRGSIITISSPRPTCAGRGGVLSEATGALRQIVRMLAGETRAFGVRVNAIAPNDVSSEHALAFLASDRSAHVTGAVLAVEPGWTALERLDPVSDHSGEAPVLGGHRRATPLLPGEQDAGGDETLRPPLPFPSRVPSERAPSIEDEYERRRA